MSDGTGKFTPSVSGGYGVITQIDGDGKITLTYDHVPPGTIVEVQLDGSTWQPAPSGFTFPVAVGSTTLIQVVQSGIGATHCTIPRQGGSGVEATYDFNWDGIEPPPPKVTVEAMESAVVED